MGLPCVLLGIEGHNSNLTFVDMEFSRVHSNFGIIYRYPTTPHLGFQRKLCKIFDLEQPSCSKYSSSVMLLVSMVGCYHPKCQLVLLVKGNNPCLANWIQEVLFSLTSTW